MSRTKLQKLLNKLDGKSEATMKVIENFDISVKALRDKLEQDISVTTLQEVNLKINKLRKSIDFSPLLLEVESLRENFKENALATLKEIENKTEELLNLINNNDKNLNLKTEILTKNNQELKKEITNFNNINTDNLTKVNKTVSVFGDTIKNFIDKKTLQENTNKLENKIEKGDEETKDYTNKVRIELLNKLSEKGGGNMNRQILVGGNPSTLGKYTDINIKAGTNMTITYSNNETTKRTDITFNSSGGSGSVGGVIRSINTISTSQTAGDVVGTDYVYLANDGIRLTLPSAVSNENLYTIKNISASSVLVSPTGADTIDTDSNLILATQFTSVDLISNGVDGWNIT